MNTERKLKIFSIMPLDTEHIDEICEDIKGQYKKGISDCVLFSMTLTPEGNPVSDKAGTACKKYALFKSKLDSMGLISGVLIQATIGHGWVLGGASPFQKMVNFNLNDNSSSSNVSCPFDEDFKEYIRDAAIKIASQSPAHIMVDDDLRLMSMKGDGCACPLHMAKFNEYAKTDLTREELRKIVTGDYAETKEYAKIMVEVQKESVVGLAKVIREGIDSVNPDIEASYCCVGNNVEFAAEINDALAAENQPRIIRINNARYCSSSGNLGFSDNFYRAAQSIAKLKGKADYILAETDTCPQNRYSTGFSSMHTHFTGTILEGATGAKQWITRMASFEPQSGVAYRKWLGSHRGFYEELANIVPKLSWRGFRIPVTDTPYFDFKKEPFGVKEGWSSCVLERLGLPMYFSAESGGVVCLEGEADTNFTDSQLKELLGGKVMLAGDTAKRICARGFSEYIGVEVKEWTGKIPTSEQLFVNGNRTKVQVGAKELIPKSEAVRPDSMVLNSVDGVNFEKLSPGSVIFKNSLGGTVITFCGTPNVPHSLTTAFSFLNYSRKLQLTKILEDIGECPVYYPDDEEIYFRAADIKDGGLFCAVFNLGYDPIEELSLGCEKIPQSIKQLMPDGSYRSVAFKTEDSRIITDIYARALDPIVLIIE